MLAAGGAPLPLLRDAADAGDDRARRPSHVGRRRLRMLRRGLYQEAKLGALCCSVRSAAASDARCPQSCTKVHPCGHPCGGVRGEAACLPCLEVACLKEERGTREDFCNICWVESVGAAPAVKLECGHVFHFTVRPHRRQAAHATCATARTDSGARTPQCVKDKLARQWSGARIHFQFMTCPLCKANIRHAMFEAQLKPLAELQQLVVRKAVQRLKYEGMEKDVRLTDASSVYYNRQARPTPRLPLACTIDRVRRAALSSTPWISLPTTRARSARCAPCCPVGAARRDMPLPTVPSNPTSAAGARATKPRRTTTRRCGRRLCHCRSAWPPRLTDGRAA
jgi:hypothetical protein